MISPSYSHTQESPLCLILFGSSIPFFVVAWLAREQPVVVAVMIGPGLLLALLGLAFHHLTVEDEGDRLAIRFGPLPFLETSILYADIQRSRSATMILDGWGIHRAHSTAGLEPLGPGLRRDPPAAWRPPSWQRRCREPHRVPQGQDGGRVSTKPGDLEIEQGHRSLENGAERRCPW